MYSTQYLSYDHIICCQKKTFATVINHVFICLKKTRFTYDMILKKLYVRESTYYVVTRLVMYKKTAFVLFYFTCIRFQTVLSEKYMYDDQKCSVNYTRSTTTMHLTGLRPKHLRRGRQHAKPLRTTAQSRCTRHENSQAVSNIAIREASILCHLPYNQCSMRYIHALLTLSFACDHARGSVILTNHNYFIIVAA